MSLAELPGAITNFVETVRAGSGAALVASFAADAAILDKGHEYRGELIAGWAERFMVPTPKIVRPIKAGREEGQTVVTVIVGEGGKAVPERFEWAFTLAGPKISTLSIRISKQPDLPPPVAAYVLATNLSDPDGLLDAFAEEAVVNDQLCEYWGKDAIRQWASRDIFGQRVTMDVVKAVQRNGNAVVTAHVDGDYDKRGLPDPLVLTFYFSVAGEKIVQLIILRNESGL